MIGLAGKEPACNAGDPGLIPGLRRSPGEGKGYPLQYSSLVNSMDRGGLQAMGLQRVRHDCATDTFIHTFFVIGIKVDLFQSWSLLSIPNLLKY